MDVLQQLREANRERCPLFGQGPIEDWSKERWALAMAGEVGEMCNLVKKSIRDGNVPPEVIGKEIADVVIYADMMAQRLGLNLAKLVVEKFNEVSDRFDAEKDAPKIARQYPEWDHENARPFYVRYATMHEGQWWSVRVLQTGGFLTPEYDPNQYQGPFETRAEAEEHASACNRYFLHFFGWSIMEIEEVIVQSFDNSKVDENEEV